MILVMAVVAAVTLGGAFGEAGASTVSVESETVVIDIYVDVAVSAQSVVAHLSAADDDTKIIALIHRGGPRYGLRTELPRKDYLVVFEAIGETPQLSPPATLTALGAQLTVPPPSGSPDAEDVADESRESTRWGWLALALGAASLSALAFWVLGARDDHARGLDEPESAEHDAAVVEEEATLGGEGE